MWLIIGQMPIKAGWWDTSLALWDFSQNNEHCFSLASFLQCPHFRSSCPELFCKKGVLKDFAKFTGASSGAGVSCEFCEILNTFIRRTPLAFAPIEVSYTNTVCNKSASVAWICLVSFYGGAKDFISTCIFLRIITFFNKI